MDKKQYYVYFPDIKQGKAIGEDEFNAKKDKLYKDYPNMEVSSISKFDQGGKMSAHDSFRVYFPDIKQSQVLSADDFAAKGDKIREKYPTAEIERISPIKWHNGKTYDTDSAEEARGKLKAFYDANGEFMRGYEANQDLYFEQAARTEMNPANLESYKYITEKRDQYKPLELERDALLAEYYNNPFIREEIEGKARVASELHNEYKANIDGAENGAERRDWRRAAKMQDDVRKLYEAPNKFTEEIDAGNGFAKFMKSYGKGMGDAFSDKDFWTMGLTEISRNMDIRGIQKTLEKAEAQKGSDLTEEDLDRILSPAQKAQIQSYAALTQAQIDRAYTLSGAYSAGQGSAESLYFMAQFLLSQGAANAVGKLAAGSTSAVASFIGRSLMTEQALNRAVQQGSGAIKASAKAVQQGQKIIAGIEKASQFTAKAGKVGGKALDLTSTVVAKPLIQGLWHTGTQLSTLQTISQHMLDTDKNDELVSTGRAIATGLLDSYIENWSESMGGAFDEVGAAIGGKLGKSALGKSSFGRFARWMWESKPSEVLVSAGFNGLIGEMGEEWVGNAARVATGIMSKEQFGEFGGDMFSKDPVKRQKAVESQLEMAASFGPMSLFGLGSSALAAKRQSKKFKEDAEKTKNILKKYKVATDEQIKDLFETKFDTASDVAEKLAPYLTKIQEQATEENRAEVQKDYQQVLNFAKETAEQSVLDAMEEEKKRSEREQMKESIQAQAGEQFWDVNERTNRRGVVKSVTNSVHVLEYDDGRRVYLRGEPIDGEYAGFDENGKTVFISEDAIREKTESGELVDRGEELLDDYLDRRIADTKASEEKARMQKEYQEQLAAVKKKVAEGNGSISFKVQGQEYYANVLSTDNDGVLISFDDGTEELHTWREIASMLGMPIQVKSDAELEAEKRMLNDAAEERAEKYKGIIKGTELTARVESGEEGKMEDQKFKLGAVVAEDGMVMFFGTDSEGKEVVYTEDQMLDLDKALAGSAVDMNEAPKAGESVIYTDKDGKEHSGTVVEGDNGSGQMVVRFEDGSLNTVPSTDVIKDEGKELKDLNDGKLRDFRGNEIPLASDGTVDEDAFWNKDPEAAARWNDDQRGDGGKDSASFIKALLRKLNKARAAKQKEFDNETSRKVRNSLEEELSEMDRRIDELTALSNKYAAAAAEAEKQAKAEKEAEKRHQRELQEPKSLIEVVSNYLARLKPFSISMKDAMRETGFKKKDLARFHPLFTSGKKGLSIIRIAEDIMRSDETGLIPQRGDVEQADTDAIRDAIIELLSSVGSLKELRNYTRNANLAREQEEKDYYEGLAEAQAAQETPAGEDIPEWAFAGFASEEEWMDWMWQESMSQESPLSDEEEYERISILADEYYNESDNGQGTEQDVSPAPAGVSQVSGTGGAAAEGEVAGTAPEGEGVRGDVRVDDEGGVQGDVRDEGNEVPGDNVPLDSVQGNDGRPVALAEDAQEEQPVGGGENGGAENGADADAGGSADGAGAPVVDTAAGVSGVPETEADVAGAEGGGEVQEVAPENSEAETPAASTPEEAGAQGESAQEESAAAKAETQEQEPVQGTLDFEAGEAQTPAQEEKQDRQDAVVAAVTGLDKEDVASRREAKRKERIAKRLAKWKNFIGDAFQVVESLEDIDKMEMDEENKAKARAQVLDKKSPAAGFFDPKTGKAYLYLPNVKDLKHLDKTIVHEVISHKGLRGLFEGKEKWNEFCDSVWNNWMNEEQRAAALEYVGGNAESEYYRRAAADEFLAHVAENRESVMRIFDETWWDKVVETAKEILNDMMGQDFFELDELKGDYFDSMLLESLADYASARRAEVEAKKAAEEASKAKEEKKEPAKPKAKRASSTKSEGKIDDFGEKIGGARKDQVRARIRDSVKYTAEDLKALKDPDKILSRKNIAKYVREGQMTQEDASMLLAVNMTARGDDSPFTKPVMLMKYRDLAAAWERGEDLSVGITETDIDNMYDQYSDNIKRQNPNLRDGIRRSLEHSLNDIESYKNTYDALNYPTVNRELKSAYVRYGRMDKRYWVVGSPRSYRGWPFKSFEDAIKTLENQFPVVESADEKVDKVKKSGDEKTGHLYVGKDQYGWYRVKSREVPGNFFFSPKFHRKEEAEKFLNENAGDLVQRELKMIEALLGSNIGMVNREGKDYRNGRDITEKEFMETFAPRGVEFGNWVPQVERQAYLNKTYDAIMDFCKIVGISPKAFFLGGQLGIGFGSRGKSGALAHYEPVKVVINLTRMKGAGSLAHEWFHALDNYLARQNTGRALGMATESMAVQRPELADAFREFVSAMNQMDYTKRSRNAGAYWGKVVERAARLFENYVYNELGGQGMVSPLLVRKDVLLEDVPESDKASWPYPSVEENEKIKPYFDRIFSTLQERTDEKGNAILFSKDSGARKKMQLDIINASNPMLDDIHTGIRSVGDIRTWAEAVAEARKAGREGGWDELAAYPDVTNETVMDALLSGEITVYSSYPITNGVFVGPSKMQAQDYAGGGEVYSKRMRVDDIAWISTDEGQVAQDEDIRFRFIGARGAAMQDMQLGPIGKRMETVTIPVDRRKIANWFRSAQVKEIEVAITRTSNLELAKAMEGEGKDAATIKTATGWEKGKDGKWRYEEGDVSLNEEFVGALLKRDMDELKHARFTLAQILKDDESYKALMAAYPKLGDIQVSFYNDNFFDVFDATRGYFDDRRNILMLNPREAGLWTNGQTSMEDLRSTLVHEIQHVIQKMEGFASGGNTGSVSGRGRLSYLERTKGDISKVLDGIMEQDSEMQELLKERDRLSEVSDEWKTYWKEVKEAKDLWEMGKLLKRPVPGNIYKYPLEERNEIANKIYHRRDAILKENEDAKTQNDLLKKVDKEISDEKYRLYRSIAGEVEARNVQARLGLSNEERLSSLAEVTEDVPRIDQIILSERKAAETVRFSKEGDALGDVVFEDDGDIRFSRATYKPFVDNLGQRHDGTRKQVIDYLRRNGFKKSQIDPFVRNMDYWFDFCGNIANLVNEDGSFKFAAFHEWSQRVPAYKEYEGRIVRAISSLVSNGEYPLNFELSTDCIKREAFTQIMDEMLALDQSFWKKLTPANIIEIQNIEKAYGVQVACPLCFVEAKRLNILGWAESVASKWNKALEAVEPGVNHTPFNLYQKGDVTVDNVTRANGEVAISPEIKREVDAINEILGDRSNVSDKDARQLAQNAQKVDALLKGWIEEYKSEHDGDAFGFVLTKAQEDALMKIRNENIKSAEARMKRVIAAHPEVRHTLSPMDLLGSTGLMRLRKMSGTGFADMFSSIVSANGTGTPKIVQRAEPYSGEIIDVSQSRFDKAASIGGARLFSFSDFDLTKVFDIMQIMWDCAARKAKVQSYSKEVPYILMFGTSGVKINMSMLPEARPGTAVMEEYKKAGTARKEEIKHAVRENVGLEIGENGEITGFHLSDSHSVTEEFAKWVFHNPLYNANCGAIMVGIGVNHAIYSMMQPHIRMVIPFHRSGMPIAAQEKGDTMWYQDFTSEQNTGFLKDGKRVKLLDSTGKSRVEGVEGDFDIYQGEDQPDWDIREKCREYVDWCQRHNLEPVFPWAVNADGYIKWMNEHGYQPRQDLVDSMRANETDGVWNEYYKVMTDFTAYQPEFDADGNMVSEKSARHLPVTGEFNTSPDVIAKVFGTDVSGSKAVSEESMLENREQSIKNADTNAREIATLAINMLNGDKKAVDMVGESTNRFNNKSDSELFLREPSIPVGESVSEMVRFSKEDALYKASQSNKMPGMEIPDIDESETIRFSLTRNNRSTIESWLNKRKDLDKDAKETVLAYIDELDTPRLQLATGRWFAQGTIRLPEDMPKVEQAVSVAEKAKVDPLQYKSPMELMDAHADFKPTEKRINPDDVPTLHKAKEIPEYGIVVYDVDDTDESRQNMRQIINTHFGKDASPWCLLQGDGEGNLTEDSKHYWGVYDAYPKQVAFRDGKLLAFSANDEKDVTWWDRNDMPYRGIPLVRKMEGDELGRSAAYEIREDGSLGNPTDIHKGNKQNGPYTEWYNDGKTVALEANYVDGQLHGRSIQYFPSGLPRAEENYDHGHEVGTQKYYYASGILRTVVEYDESGNIIRGESFHENGSRKSIENFRDNKRDGLFQEWYDNGTLMTSSNWSKGFAEGKYESYYRNGNRRSQVELVGGMRNGVEKNWYENGTLESTIEYKDNRRHGTTMLYYSNGQPYEEKHYINGKENGVFREWVYDGILTAEYNLKDGNLNGVRKTWNNDGNLIAMAIYKDGEMVRDLLAEGVSEEDADNIRFSKANQTQNGFISNAEAALNNIQQEKATPEQWIKMLEGKGGLKAGEDKWLGLSDWIKSQDRKTITKQEIADYIAKNRIQIEETHYSENGDEMAIEKAHPGFSRAYYLDEDEFRGGVVFGGINNLDAAIELFNSEHEDKIAMDEEGASGHAVSDEDYERLLDFGKSLVSKGEASFGKINLTRLRYTTEGLENKAEIALTVPTIQPYQTDEIHFVDAGEGRAIAWIRFGTTYISKAEQVAEQEYQVAKDRWIAYKQEITNKYALKATGTSTVKDLATDEENAKLKDLYLESVKKEKEWRHGQHAKEKVLVIDEIQSKRHQDARDKEGYTTEDISAYEKAASDAYKAWSDYTDMLREKYKIRDLNRYSLMVEIEKKATEEEFKEAARLNQIANVAEDERRKVRAKVPAAPFEKNWHELAMKRMLRYAAENGYDYIAWTTGEQQADRYNMESAISALYASRDGDKYYVEVYGRNGDIVEFDGLVGDSRTSGSYTKDELNRYFGKEAADQIVSGVEGLPSDKELDKLRIRAEQTGTKEDRDAWKEAKWAKIDGKDLFKGEGMKGFYDEILPRFMNKYGKKWGVSVSDMFLPNIGDDALAGIAKGMTMHSVPVTQEMKESVMEGQLMFKKASAITTEMDAEYLDAVKAGDMAKAQELVAAAARRAFPESVVVDEFYVPKVVLHGTKRQFNAFDPKMIGTANDAGWLGRGFYFYGNNPVYASQYANFDNPKGGRVIKAFLNIENPYWASIEDFRRLAESNSPEASEEFTQMLKEEGYDGVYYNGDGNEEWVAFYPNQIKSADPVTYDDKGNVIPLSERFNPEKEDIRFSKRMANDNAVMSVDREGIAGIVGAENESDFYADVVKALPPEIRRDVINIAAKNGYDIKAAAKEYIAARAAQGFENDNTGELRLFAEIMKDFAENGELLDDSSVRYALWRSGQEPGIMTEIASIANKNRWGVGKEEEIRFSKGDLSADLDATRAEVSATVTESATTRKEGMKSLTKDLLTAAKAMAVQKEYDRSTVKLITDTARQLLKDQNIDKLSRQEVARLLGIVTAANGKSPASVKKYGDLLVDAIVKHLLRSEKNALDSYLKIKAGKVNATGVEVQGVLDVRGQNILKAVKAGMAMPLAKPGADVEENDGTIDGRLLKLEARMRSKDDAVRKEAEEEYIGLTLAKEYLEEIDSSISEEDAIRDEMDDAKEEYKDGKMGATEYREYVHDAEESIRENNIERVEAYRALREKLVRMINESKEAAKEFLEAEQDRKDAIHHLASSDMQGRDASPFRKPTRAGRLANSAVVRFFTAPLATFDQMLRLFGEKDVSGQGYLHNRFMRQWTVATENAYLGQKEAKDELDRKVSEVFGKEMQWSDLYQMERSMPKVSVSWWDGGEKREHLLTQGNLLYIYMVNKMADGRMKLRRMGITEADVKAIERQMSPEFLELAKWMQEEFLVDKRNKYNAVHERLFGASMAAIDQYFPLKINKRSLNKKEDIGNQYDGESMPATTTGSIIKRRRNSQDLDLLNADAFSVMIEHVEQMEQWAAFAEFNRDINTLLSDKHFRNQVQNMTTIYGTGPELWKKFKECCRIAGNSYHPAVDKNSIDNAAVNLAKGVTSAKISFRIYTALKQFLSMPAFLSDANVGYLAANIANPWKAWYWALENLPIVEKRWKSRIAGDTRLMNTESDWKYFRSNMYDFLSKWGMAPNAFVDALTVSIGAHAMYQTKYNRYIKDGYTEEEADKRAKQDATILYNETQQSSEGAFVSEVQLSRTALSTAISVFRNSSFGYQRQLHDALRNLGKLLTPGYKERSVEFMKKQMMRDGLTEEQAEHAANRRYNRAWLHNMVRVANFGFVVQFAWNLGGSLAYLLFGDDDDEKQKMLTEAAKHALYSGWAEGLAGGNIVSDAMNRVFVTKEGLRQYNPTLLPIVSDVKNVINKLSYDQPGALNEVFNIAVQALWGINPQTITDTVEAVVDACGGEMETSKEAMLLIMRVLQVPQSQLDQIYIDELGMTGKDAKKLSYREMARRYAEYKVDRNAPVLGWAYSDKEREKRENAYLKRFKKLTNERKDLKKNTK